MLTEIPFGLPGRVFRSPMPYGDLDPGGTLFSEFRRQGISAVVLLVEDMECRSRTGFDLRPFYLQEGLEVIHLPIPDFGIPSREALEAVIPRILEVIYDGRHVVIHCYAGIGRTGLVMACLARSVLGLSGEEAVLWVRRYIPGAVESQEQRELVEVFKCFSN